MARDFAGLVPDRAQLCRMTMKMPASFVLFALLAAFIALPATMASAQEDFSGTTYITPYPEGDTYRLQVYGDAFASGLLDGLVDALSGDTRLQIQKKHRALPGLIRPDLEDELKAEEANREPLHIAVVMVGRQRPVQHPHLRPRQVRRGNG